MIQPVCVFTFPLKYHTTNKVYIYNYIKTKLTQYDLSFQAFDWYLQTLQMIC